MRAQASRWPREHTHRLLFSWCSLPRLWPVSQPSCQLKSCTGLGSKRNSRLSVTALQGWVSEAGADHAQRRKFSLSALTGLGLAGWLIIASLGPWAGTLLFGSWPDFWTCFWFGLSFLLVCVTTSTGAHWLVPAKRMPIVFSSTIAGAVVGLPAMVILAHLLGGQGGALGLVLGEVAVTAIQMRAIVSLLRDKTPEDKTEDISS